MLINHKFKFFIAVLFFLFVFPSYGLPSQSTETKTITIKSVGVSQIVEHPALDAVRQGMLAALEENGFVENKNLKVYYENAQGNMVIATQIANKLLSIPPDVLVGISTPSAQTLLNAAQRNDKPIPIVFTAVSDPIAAKLEAGDLHYPITGITDEPNLEAILELIQKALPKLKTLGVIYNPSESNSVATINRLKQILKTKKIETVKLYEVTVNGTSDVPQAMKSLVGKVDALYFPQDNTIVSVIETVVNLANQSTIPLFCSDPLLVQRGVLAAVGYDYFEVGKETGKVIAQILNGESINQIPIRSPKQLKTEINQTLAKKLNLKIS